MKKLLCVVMCLVVSLIMLSACVDTTTGDGAGSITAPETTAGTTVLDPTEETTVPENTEETTGPVDDRITLVIGIGETVYDVNLKNSAYTKYLEEKTGINLEFKVIYRDAKNYSTLLEAGTGTLSVLPDILIDAPIEEDTANKYAAKGVLVNLAAYLDDPEKSANFWSCVQQVREDPDGQWDRLMDDMLQTMYTKDATGNDAVYALPNVKTSLVDTIDFMPFINQKWLDALKLEAPTTPTELLTVLRAFRDNDPNGNKEKDEIPMMGYVTNTSKNDILAWLINFFVYCDKDVTANLLNGQIYVAQAHEAYREAIKQIHDMMAEGLMAPQSLTYSVNNLKLLVSNTDQIGLVVGDPKSMFADETVAARFSPLNLYGYAYYNQEKVQYDTFITANCKNVDAAWALLMCMYTEEAALFQKYGVQGEHWEYADGTAMTEYGLPASIKILKKLEVTEGTNWMSGYMSFTTYKISELIIDPNATGKDIAIQKLYGAQYQNYKAACDWTQRQCADMICPVLDYGDKAADMAKLTSKLRNVISDWTKYFLTGAKNIDDPEQWYQYTLALKHEGLDEYLSIAQQCYDRMYPNGH